MIPSFLALIIGGCAADVGRHGARERALEPILLRGIAGSPQPMVQNLPIFFPGERVPYNAQPGVPWLSVIPSSGSLPGNLDIEIHGESLGRGRHETCVKLALEGPDDVLSIPVTVDLAPADFAFFPASLSMRAENRWARIAQDVAVRTSPEGLNARWKASWRETWLEVHPREGRGAANIKVVVDPRGAASSRLEEVIVFSSEDMLVPARLPVVAHLPQEPVRNNVVSKPAGPSGDQKEAQSSSLSRKPTPERPDAARLHPILEGKISRKSTQTPEAPLLRPYPKQSSPSIGASSGARKQRDVSVISDVECGHYVERVDWLEPGRHVRAILKRDIPNHWFLFQLEGVAGRTLSIEVVGTHTMHGGFRWEGVQAFVVDAGDLSWPGLCGRGGVDLNGLPAWRRLENTVYDKNRRTLSMETSFRSNGATVALRIPCPPSYVARRLREMAAKGVGSYEIGCTPEGRSLPVVLIPPLAGNEKRWKEKPTFLLYGGEHATEHDSMHIVMGALEWLAGSDRDAAAFRDKHNVMLAPQVFPDDTGGSIFNRGTEGFAGKAYGYVPENVSWAVFFNRWMDEGYAMDVAVSLHNVAGTEDVNFFSPATQVTSKSEIEMRRLIHTAIVGRFGKSNFMVRTEMGKNYHLPMRLFGWLDARFSVAGLTFEVNGQYPRRRLSLTELRSMGREILKGIADFSAIKGNQDELRSRRLSRMSERKSRMERILAGKSLEWLQDPPEWVTFNMLW